MDNLSFTDKKKKMCLIDYVHTKPFPYKINMEILQWNVTQECYRDQLVSFANLAPLSDYQVRLEEADYILYANPFARVEDFTDYVLEDIEYIDERRKDNAEIIIMGKACNIKPYIDNKYSNITYVPSHYTEYVGKRFGLDIKEEYLVYDNELGQLNIWPVDGCNNKCGFCRRTYMHIPYESQSLEFLKEQLDYYAKEHPEQMELVSLRAENLTEYGIDLYGKPMLHKVIDLIDSYDEVKYIYIPIGLCIGEITDEILDSIVRCKKIFRLALNLEAGSDRLLKLVNKKHTCEDAKRIFKTILESKPDMLIDSTVMVGLPTEELEDIYSLSNLILECGVTYLHCNYYGYSPKHPIAKYEQISDSLREYHLKLLIRLLKKNFDNNYMLEMRHESILDKSKRSTLRAMKKLEEEQKSSLPRILNLTYENFIGKDISVKTKDGYNLRRDTEELIRRAVKIKKHKQKCLGKK